MRKNPRSLVPTKEVVDKRDAKQLWRNSNTNISREGRRIASESRRQQRREEELDRVREQRVQTDDNEVDFSEQMEDANYTSDEDMPLATKLALVRGTKRRNNNDEEEEEPVRRKTKQRRTQEPSRRKRPIEASDYDNNRRKVFLIDEEADVEQTGPTPAQNRVPLGNELATLDQAVANSFDDQLNEERRQLEESRENVEENSGWESTRGNRDSDAPLIRVEDMMPNSDELNSEPLTNFQERTPQFDSLPQLPQTVEETAPITQQRSSVSIFRPVIESVFKRTAQPIKSVPEPLTDLQQGFSVDLPTIAFASFTQRLNLRRVLLVLNATAPVDAQTQRRKWSGIKTFFNYYFGSTLKLFLGKRSVVRIFLITSKNDLCAKLYRLDGGSRYVLAIVANFDYWDSLVELADSLPDVYFRSNSADIARTYLRQLNEAPLSASAAKSMREPIPNRISSAMLKSFATDSTSECAANIPSESRVVKNIARIDGQEVEIKRGTVNDMYSNATVYPSPHETTQQTATSDAFSSHCDNNEQDDDEDSPIDQAVGGLCLAHLIEMLIEKDLKSKVPNYVTLGQLFSGDKSTINPFKVQLHYR